MARTTKYFVIVEGNDRGILRNRLGDALKKRKTMKKYNPGKKVHIFKAEKIQINDETGEIDGQ